MSDHPFYSDPIARVRKVSEPYGILGNMSTHPIVDEFGVTWPRAEHLFQAMRFPAGSSTRELIRREKQPMQAKAIAKARVDEMLVTPMSEQDLNNMRGVLLLKYAQHADVRACLASTRGLVIVEDCTNRQRGSGLFWGAALRDEGWVGHNWLGRLWMEIRA
jgi:ribA/ribD-fused uncharacterized protein